VEKSAVKRAYRRFTEEFSIWDILLILLGSTMGPFALQALLTPNGLLTGGVTGVAVLLEFVTGVKTWIWYTAINIPIFIAGFRFVSPRFFLYSIVGTAAFSAFLGAFEGFNGMFSGENLLMNAVIGGLLSGVGCGIVLKGKGSGGGMDIVAVILRRKWGFQLGEVMLAVNMLIIAASAFITSAETAFYSGIAMLVSSKMIDRVMMGLGGNKTVMIVSRQEAEIAQAVLLDLHRGCTVLSAEGGYTHQNSPVLLVSIYRSQLPVLKEMIFKIDPGAFVIVYESNEVYGRGFSSSKSEF